MSRRICLTLAAAISLAGYNLALAQSTAPATAATSASDENDVVQLKAENAELKKEVSDAAKTIAELQAQLAQAGVSHPAVTASSTPPVSGAVTGTATASAAPTGPLKALPLDSTNVVANAAAPGADAGPSRSYTVVKGDSLWKIAHKMYPHDTLNGEDKIREANKDVFNGKFLQPGQVLVIP